MGRLSRTALEEQERKYLETVEDLGEPSEVDTTNSLKYDKADKTLKYDALQFLDENAADENLPENLKNARVFIKYEMARIDTGRRFGRYVNANYEDKWSRHQFGDKVHGLIFSEDGSDLSKTREKTTAPVKYKLRNQRNASDGTKETFTWVIDVTDIIEPEGGMGFKDWAKNPRDMSVHDTKKRVNQLNRRINDVLKKEGDFLFGYNDNDDYELQDWADTRHLNNRNNKNYNQGGYFFTKQGGAKSDVAKMMIKNMNKTNDTNHNVALRNEFNPKFNDYGSQINNFNKNYNKNLRVKEDVYKDAINIANQTAGGDYTDQREKIRLIKKLEEAGINAEDSQKILGDVEDTFKAFYRGEKLKKFDFGSEDDNLSYINTKAKPPVGTFDPDYYKTQSLPHQTQTEQEKWNDAVADDDIDITERYGDETGFYLYRYGQQRGLGELRGNAADPLDKTEGIVETAPTDAEIQTYRDDMLTIKEDDPQAVIDNVEYIKKAYEDAIKAREDGTPNKFVEAAGDLLNVNNPDEFLLVYRQVGDEADLEALRNFSDEGFKITDLEDAITGVLGEEALVQTKKFGALTQNVLTDTMNELKRAKAKEQELATLGQFSTFGEIMDINKSLTDSLLGDTGVGGFLGFAGKNSGFDPKTLEKQLSKVTGVNNNVIYNWQEWFDDSIKKNYSEFEDEYLTLGYTKEEAEEAAREEVNIQKSFAESYITNYLQPRFNESRSMHEFVEYLDVQDEEQNPFQTQSTLNALNQVAELKANKYLQDIEKNAKDQEFDYEFYFNPTGAGTSKYLQDLYQKQKNIVEEDWRRARENPQVLIRGGDVNAPTWAEVAYQYGVDVEDQEAFARLHYQVKGQFEEFDPAKDAINPGQVQEYIDTEIVPLLVEEAGENTDVFGQFIRPDEYADEMLEGLDPNVPESWEEALTGSDGESLLGDFQGDFEDLRGYLAETFRTGSAENIRRNIKYLNEKREKPTQELLGVEYIQREEDYKTDAKLQGDTQLFKTFQSAGYEGSEDDFYKDVFPDLDKSTQSLLSQVGEKGTFEIPGLSGFNKNTDPIEAFISVGQLLGDDTFGLEKQEEKQEDKKKSSYFTFDVDYDEEYKTKKSTSGSEFLNQFTQGFSVYD
tara:strand:- start:3104 stop:6469 length:3366 start_codon:yes stop_codon:yes gene_type:complete